MLGLSSGTCYRHLLKCCIRFSESWIVIWILLVNLCCYGVLFLVFTCAESLRLYMGTPNVHKLSTTHVFCRSYGLSHFIFIKVGINHHI
jgi:hypothetical protein